MLQLADRLWQPGDVNVEEPQAEALFILDFLQDSLVDFAKLEHCSCSKENHVASKEICCIEDEPWFDQRCMIEHGSPKLSVTQPIKTK